MVFVAFVIDLAFSLCLAGFLIMHGRLIANNMTTIEMWVSVCLLALPELCINFHSVPDHMHSLVQVRKRLHQWLLLAFRPGHQ